MARALAFVSAALLLPVACSSVNGGGVEDPPVDADGGGTSDASPIDGAATPRGDAGPNEADASDASTTDPGPQLVQPKTVCPASYQTSGPVVGQNANFSIAGQQRSFTLLMPPPSFTGPRPLLVAFHGTGGSGQGFANGVGASFAAKGFVVVAPNSAGNGSYWPVWDAMRLPGAEGGQNKDLELFDALVACTAAHYAIDKTRVFVTGHSAGGIFTNKVLRARSSVVAGGIVASGVFSLTQSGSTAPLDDMFVIVTWGGDNDKYSGATPSGAAITNFSFSEEATLASSYYEAQPAVTHAHCRGNNVGHSWLSLGDWFANALLTHPKGANDGPLAPLPAGAPATCSSEAATLAALSPIACGASATNGCQESCQVTADCIGENRTVGPTMPDTLSTTGITATSCSDCITRCQQSGNLATNATVLACFKAASATAQCAGGVEGALPFMKAVETCCKDRGDSPLCVALCSSIKKSGAVASFVPACQAIAP